jgi:2-acylglycerol O-acyltransferase 2
MCQGTNWKWWQAFEGGWRFVTMQAVSWFLFSLAVLVGAWSIRYTVMLEGTWTLTGTLGFLSELIMVISIKMYLPKLESCDATPGSTQAWLNNVVLLGKRARRFLVTVLLFNVFFAPIMLVISIAIPFLFTPTWVWGSVITLLVAVYTPAFFLTNPHQTGVMDSPKLRTSFLVEDVIRYFNGRLVKTAEIDTTKQYIFGYHPHGILPLAAMWATNSPSWKMFQTTRDTITLIASHLFRIPVTREFLSAAGAREVSKQSFQYALGQGRSVVLVPGGMKEMRQSLSTTNEIVVCRSHKGFVKMAITHGVDLVPMFSFGETKLLDCAFPELQKFCWSKLGIPFPLFIGRWNLPIPRPQQVTILVGPAIPVMKNPEPTQEEIDTICDLYFDTLQTMFEQNKEACGHPSSTLVFL